MSTSLADRCFRKGDVLLRVVSVLFSSISFRRTSAGGLSVVSRVGFCFSVGCTRGLGLGSMTSCFNVRRGCLAQTFRRGFKVSPGGCLLRLGFGGTTELLTAARLPISVVSGSLKFRSRLTFSHAFGGFCGISPASCQDRLGPWRFLHFFVRFLLLAA